MNVWLIVNGTNINQTNRFVNADYQLFGKRFRLSIRVISAEFREW
jgi:hypothetical protein